MRKKLSKEYNFTSTRDIFQINDMDKALKNRIWNEIIKYYFDTITLDEIYSSDILHKNDFNFFKNISNAFFKSDKKINNNLDGLRVDIQIY